MSNTSDDWQTLYWLNDARRLIQWTRKQSSNQPMMLVIRHSHREDSANAQELLEKHLTDLGHRMAFRFGKELPLNRIMEIFFSGHPRCRETAQEISKGYKEAGRQASLVSDHRFSMGPQGSGDRIGHEMLRLGSAEFIRLWTEGKLSAETIVPIEELRSAFMRETVGRLRNTSRNSLQIHVTHDLMIMGMRSILFGTTPSYEKWVPYLGGYGAVLVNDVLHAFENGKELTLDDDALLASSKVLE